MNDKNKLVIDGMLLVFVLTILFIMGLTVVANPTKKIKGFSVKEISEYLEDSKTKNLMSKDYRGINYITYADSYSVSFAKIPKDADYVMVSDTASNYLVSAGVSSKVRNVRLYSTPMVFVIPRDVAEELLDRNIITESSDKSLIMDSNRFMYYVTNDVSWGELNLNRSGLVSITLPVKANNLIIERLMFWASTTLNGSSIKHSLDVEAVSEGLAEFQRRIKIEKELNAEDYFEGLVRGLHSESVGVVLEKDFIAYSKSNKKNFNSDYFIVYPDTTSSVTVCFTQLTKRADAVYEAMADPRNSSRLWNEFGYRDALGNAGQLKGIMESVGIADTVGVDKSDPAPNAYKHLNYFIPWRFSE